MKKILIIVHCSFLFSVSGQINLDSGLVAYYPFEGDANDLSTYTLNGIPSNVTYSTGVFGLPNSSALFDGTDSSYVDCGVDNRGIDDTITISAFVRTTFDGIGDIVSKYDPGNDHGYHFQLSLGKIRFAGRDGSGAYRSTGFSLTSINDSVWHHIVGQVFGNTWVIYIDCTAEGAQSASFASPDISSNANLGIGKDVFNDQKYLDCEVDEVRIYDRLLTTDEMDSLCATAILARVPESKKKDEHFHIYPNPATEKLTLVVDGSLEDAQIEIYDFSGKKLHDEIAQYPTVVVDIAHLNPGNYLVKISSNGLVRTEYFIKF